MRISIVLAILCLFFMACLKPPRDNEYDPENPDKAYLAGTVYDGFNNNSPSGNARVILMHDGHDWSDTTTTDGSGWYEFDKVDPGFYEGYAEAGHYWTDALTESLPAGFENDSLDLFLCKALFDFEDEPLNTQEPQGFSVVETTWAVVDDPGQGHVYMGTTPGTGLAIAVADPVVDDFYYECMVKVDPSSDSTFFTGVLFRYHDLQNFYGVIFSINHMEVLKVDAGAWTMIDSIWRAFSISQWYKLTVDCCGDHIQVFLDNSSTPLLDIHDSTFLDGQVGLFVEHLSSTRFDDVYINVY